MMTTPHSIYDMTRCAAGATGRAPLMRALLDLPNLPIVLRGGGLKPGDAGNSPTRTSASRGSR
jgi:hypothetical protein